MFNKLNILVYHLTHHMLAPQNQLCVLKFFQSQLSRNVFRLFCYLSAFGLNGRKR